MKSQQSKTPRGINLLIGWENLSIKLVTEIETGDWDLRISLDKKSRQMESFIFQQITQAGVAKQNGA